MIRTTLILNFVGESSVRRQESHSLFLKGLLVLLISACACIGHMLLRVNFIQFHRPHLQRCLIRQHQHRCLHLPWQLCRIERQGRPIIQQCRNTVRGIAVSGLFQARLRLSDLETPAFATDNERWSSTD